MAGPFNLTQMQAFADAIIADQNAQDARITALEAQNPLTLAMLQRTCFGRATYNDAYGSWEVTAIQTGIIMNLYAVRRITVTSVGTVPASSITLNFSPSRAWAIPVQMLAQHVAANTQIVQDGLLTETNSGLYFSQPATNTILRVNFDTVSNSQTGTLARTVNGNHQYLCRGVPDVSGEVTNFVTISAT